MVLPSDDSPSLSCSFVLFTFFLFNSSSTGTGAASCCTLGFPCSDKPSSPKILSMEPLLECERTYKNDDYNEWY